MKKLLVLVFGLFFLSGCTKDKPTAVELTKTKESTTQSTLSSADQIMEDFANGVYEKDSSVQPEPRKLELGEEGLLKNADNEPYYSLKIINATTNLSETDSFYVGENPSHAVEITYEYKNYSAETPIIINSQFINAYDESGLAGKTQSIMIGQNEVPKGRSAQTTIFVVFNKDVTNLDEIEIEYVNDFSLGFEGAMTFKVPLSH